MSKSFYVEAQLFHFPSQNAFKHAGQASLKE